MADPKHYRDYKICEQECSVEDTPEEIEKCVEDIRQRYKDPTLCAKITKPECHVIRTKGFADLMRFLIKFFKLQYCCRVYHAYQHDISFITTLGVLDLTQFGLSIDDLNCVKLQDYTAPGFPSNLGDYFRILGSIRAVGYDITQREPKFRKFYKFLEDSQPWSRVLTTCVDKYVRELGILESGIPDISKIRSYGDFTSECDKDVIDNEILPYLTDNPEYILRYIMGEPMSSFDSSSSSSRVGTLYYDLEYKPKSPKKSKKSNKSKKSKKSKNSNKSKKSK